MIKAAVELTTQKAPKWEMIAARLLLFTFERELKKAEAVSYTHLDVYKRQRYELSIMGKLQNLIRHKAIMFLRYTL